MGAARPVLDLRDASVASSGRFEDDGAARRTCRHHFDGGTRAGVTTRRFVGVIARTCMMADALTKVVLAAGPAAGSILARDGAIAHMFSAEGGWEIVDMSCG
jgi:thiamine biosynthesis lipoprotein